MKKKISICFLAMAITLGTYIMAYGLSSYKTQFNARYGTTGTAIDQCILCHATNNGPQVPSTEIPPNPYGVALESNGLNFAAAEPLDSDGDGFNNITEINARTFPGNSASKPATSDTTPPSVTAFTIPAASSSLTVSITTFMATDNVGVTGYMVTESATAPLATAAGWGATAPTSYTASAVGARTLYAWAKDAAGNVSTSRSASVTITLPADTTPPTVTSFTIPATSSSLTVSISSFAATDNVGVTGHMVTESATAPLATAAGWSATPPTSYTFATAGAKTLYAWAKDAAGNVSLSRSASVTISVPPTPTWASIPGFTPSAPAVAWNPTAQKVHILVRGMDDSIWAATFNSNGTFNNDWTSIPGATPSSPALAWNPIANELQLVVRGEGDTIWAATFNSNGTFNNDWTSIPGATPSSPALAWDDSLSELCLIVRGKSNDSIWFATFNSSGVFNNDWVNLPGATPSSPGMTYLPSQGAVNIVVRGSDGSLWGLLY
jgi:hypothetical protein